MTLFLIIVVSTLVVSSLCSLSEAALYSVPLAYVKHLDESGYRSGRILLQFKQDIGRPVAAVLILNTVANSAGPAVAGAIAADLWGPGAVVWFAGGITLAVLFLSEITPKIAGVTYCKSISRAVALPLLLLIKLLYPLMWISYTISRMLKSDEEKPLVSQEEVLTLAALGTQEGCLDHLQGSVISNVIGLDQLLVRDVLTPRVVVFRLQDNMTIAELKGQITEWSFTRIPVYPEENPDHLTHYVMQLDIYREILRGQESKRLKDIARPLTTVPELMPVDKLLLQMFEKKEQMCAVVDEYGGLAGIITMEDIIEEIVGREIMDEYDSASDLRSFAGLLQAVQLKKRRAQQRQVPGEPGKNPEQSGAK